MTSLDHPLGLLEALDRADITCSGGRAPDWTAAGLDKSTIVQTLKDADLARHLVVQGVGAAVTESLAGRVQDWLLTESTRRQDAGALEYHDLLVLARDVLQADPDVRRRLHDQWPTLLIDEFQDTDPLQVEIACLLAGTGDEGPGSWEQIDIEPGRLFFVSDAKQSIYRFRRADIDIFQAVGAKHVPARLQVNFRSVPGVLRAANAAFTSLIGADPLAGIPYTDLVPFRQHADEQPPVLLLGGPHPGASAADLRQQESAHLADVAVRAKRDWTIAGARRQRSRTWPSCSRPARPCRRWNERCRRAACPTASRAAHWCGAPTPYVASLPSCTLSTALRTRSHSSPRSATQV